MAISKRRMILDGKQVACQVYDTSQAGWNRVRVFNEQGVPVSEHSVPSELFTMGGKATTGGHTYETLREGQTMSDNYSHDTDATSDLEQPIPCTYGIADLLLLLHRATEAGMGVIVSYRNFEANPSEIRVCLALWWDCKDDNTYPTDGFIEQVAKGDMDKMLLPIYYVSIAHMKNTIYESVEDFVLAKEKDNAIAAGNEFFGGAA